MNRAAEQNEENAKSKLPENAVARGSRQNIGGRAMALNEAHSLYGTGSRYIGPLPRELRTARRRSDRKNSARNQRDNGNPKKSVSVCI